MNSRRRDADSNSGNSRLKEIERLNRDRQAFDAEVTRMTTGQSSDVLRLTVGVLGIDREMDVQRSTLTSVKGSALAAMFSGRWDERLPKNMDGAILIDHHVGIFCPMIECLLAKARGESAALTAQDIDRPIDFLEYLAMVDYYGLTDAFYPSKIVQIISSETFEIPVLGDDEVIPESYVQGVRIKTTNMWSLYLEATGHSRPVVGLEIVLEEGTEEIFIVVLEGSLESTPIMHSTGPENALGYFWFRLYAEQYRFCRTNLSGDDRLVVEGLCHHGPGSIIRYSYTDGRHTVQVNEGEVFTAPAAAAGRCGVSSPYVWVRKGHSVSRMSH
jgi:hypothetical protein